MEPAPRAVLGRAGGFDPCPPFLGLPGFRPQLERMTQGRTSRTQSGWAMRLGLLAVVPALLLVPVLGGDALLLHDHGQEGDHFHVVSGQASERHDHHATHQEFRLADEHQDHELSPAPDEHQHEGSGVLISFSGALHLSSVGAAQLSRPAPSFLFHFVAEPRARSRVDPPAFVGAGPPGRARPGRARSGVAAVLVTSCAILI